MLIYIHYANTELHSAFCFLGHSLPGRGIKMTLRGFSHLDSDGAVNVLPVENHLCVKDGTGGIMLHRGAHILVLTLDKHIGICS